MALASIHNHVNPRAIPRIDYKKTKKAVGSKNCAWGTSQNLVAIKTEERVPSPTRTSMTDRWKHKRKEIFELREWTNEQMSETCRIFPGKWNPDKDGKSLILSRFCINRERKNKNDITIILTSLSNKWPIGKEKNKNDRPCYKKKEHQNNYRSIEMEEVLSIRFLAISYDKKLKKYER